jgi:serine/threonine-protein kinase
MSDPPRPRSRCTRAASLAFAALILAAASRDARGADDVGAEAEALFRAGKKLMDEGNFGAACPKLAESQRLDPGNGTLARLATCHEKEGKLATAWSEFAELVTSAQRAGQADREKFARQRVDALQPQLSHLTIRVPADVAALSGISVRRDGVTVGPAVSGIAVPVDPGQHVLEASAPGRTSWSVKITIGAIADSQEVSVPMLDPVPAAVELPAPAFNAPLAPDASHPTNPASATRRTLGVVIGAAGVMGLGIGSYFGIQAISDSSKAKSACPDAACTSSTAVDQNNQAKSSARVADIVIPIGLVGIIAGSLLSFLAPSDGPRVEPVVGTTNGVRVSTSW